MNSQNYLDILKDSVSKKIKKEAKIEFLNEVDIDEWYTDNEDKPIPKPKTNIKKDWDEYKRKVLKRKIIKSI